MYRTFSGRNWPVLGSYVRWVLVRGKSAASDTRHMAPISRRRYFRFDMRLPEKVGCGEPIRLVQAYACVNATRADSASRLSWSTRASTPENRTVSRMRLTNSTDTAAPYQSPD